MNKEKKEALIQVNKQLDNMFNSVKTICDKWEVKTAPILTIEKVIELGMIDTEKLKGHSLEFSNSYNSILERLILACNNSAADMGTDKIPLALFKDYIDSLKEGFEKGLKKKPTKEKV